MNHKKVYKDIIEKSKSKNKQKGEGIYYEKHHIIPRCLDGGNEKENLVLLTAREHFICHKLLIYIYPNYMKILIAFHHIAFNKKYNKYVSSRDYEYARLLFLKFLKSDEHIKHLRAINLYRNGKSYEELYGPEKAKNIKEKQSINHDHYWKGKKVPQELIEKRANSNIGKKQTEELKDKIRKSLLSTKHTEERKKNISNSLKGKKFGKNFGKPRYGKDHPNFVDISHLTDIIIKLHTEKLLTMTKIGKTLKIDSQKVKKLLIEKEKFMTLSQIKKARIEIKFIETL